MSGSRHYITPFVLPVAAFVATIALGSLLLSLDICAAGTPVPFVDALFIATSAVCVTGLASVDVFTAFNRTGQSVVLALIQLGGLGIVTYTTLVFYMLGKRIQLRDRLAVAQGLFYDPSFDLGRFLQRMVVTVLLFETAGAAVFYFFEPDRIGPFNAVFLSVSAFCNAGFAPWQDSLAQWRNHWGVGLGVMTLIVAGGIGYYVIEDISRVVMARIARIRRLRGRLLPLEAPDTGGAAGAARIRLQYFSRVALSTTAFLIIAGAGAVFLLEANNAAWQGVSFSERVHIALFQSVTSRTAGFATVDMALLTDAALFATMILMFIGGSPGSAAGGIKTTTFRILWGYLLEQLRGHTQIVVAGRAVPQRVGNKAMILFGWAVLTVIVATFALMVTENGGAPHGAAPFRFVDIFFEVVSAFATTGLSVNLTPLLSAEGKVILCGVMLVGKLGPVWLVTTIQQFQTVPAYRFPEESMPVG